MTAENESEQMQPDEEKPILKDGVVLNPPKRAKFERHSLEVIAELVAGGVSIPKISAITGHTTKSLKRLLETKKASNKTFTKLLREAHYRTDVAGIQIKKRLLNEDNFELCVAAWENALRSTDEALALEAAKDMMSLAGVLIPRDQKGPAVAMQVNVGMTPETQADQERKQEMLTKATTSVFEQMSALAASLPSMDNNPHITTTGTGPQLGDESSATASGAASK